MASHHVVNGRWRVKVVTVDPDAVRFTVAQAPGPWGCSGCLFDGNPHAVCVRAAEIARNDGLVDCDDKLPNGKACIYVIDRSDPRQLPLLDPAQAPA